MAGRRTYGRERERERIGSRPSSHATAERAPETLALQRLLSGSRTGAPLRAGELHSLQRLVGNRATAQLARGRRPVVQREVGEDVDSGVGVTSGLSNIVGTGSTIGTSANLVKDPTGTSQQVGSGVNGVVLSGVALPLSAWQLARSGVELNEQQKRLGKAKASGDKKLVRTRGRARNIAGGNVTSNVGNTSGAITGVVTGGIGIAGTLAQSGSALSTAGNVAGVAGAVIATPIQLFTLVRTSRQANLQRERWGRAESVQKALKSVNGSTVNPEELINSSLTPKQRAEQAKKDALVDQGKHEKLRDESLEDKKRAEQHRDELEKKVGELDPKVEDASKALAAMELRAKSAKEKGESIDAEELERERMALKALEQEKKGLQDDLEKARKQVEQHADAIKTHQGIVDQHALDIADHEKTIDTHAKLIDSQNAMKTDTAKSGHLDSGGQAEGKMPTLAEIADYAVSKNRRGFARRAIGAGAAALGVVAGAIGIAAAVETLQNNSQLGADLGIAGAVIGGAAALIGIGVGIWKAVSFFKKRKAQAAKMAITAPPGKKPGAFATYNPFRKTVDQTTKRRHYARALFNYATRGTPEQREEAAKIMAALDPKGPWAEKDPNGKLAGITASTVDAENDEVIEHLMAKMASGG